MAGPLTDSNQSSPAPALARAEPWVVALLLAYFAVRLVYFATHLDPTIPPDELLHMERSELFATTIGTLPNNQALAEVSFVPGGPYLYYWLAGRLIKQNFFAGSDNAPSNLVLLRLVNGLLGIATVLYGWRWMRMFSVNPITRLLFVTMMTNTLMFTVISVTASYDALVNLCAAAAIFHLSAFLLRSRGDDLVCSVFFLSIGVMTKTTLLPLVALLVLVLLIHQRRHLGTAPRAVVSFLRAPKPVRWARLAVTLAVTGFGIWHYSANLLQYGALVPAHEQVYDGAGFVDSPARVRNDIMGRYYEEQLTYAEAVRAAGKIEHDSTRRDTINLLKGAEMKRRSGFTFSPMPRPIYFFPWTYIMATSIFGLLAHEEMIKKGLPLLPYFTFFFLAAAMFVQRWGSRESEDGPSENFGRYVLFIFAGYALILMQLVNYPVYVRDQELIVTLQGRYIFPVILPFYGLAARYGLDYFAKPLQIAIAAAMALAFLYGDFPYFLRHEDMQLLLGNP